MKFELTIKKGLDTLAKVEGQTKFKIGRLTPFTIQQITETEQFLERLFGLRFHISPKDSSAKIYIIESTQEFDFETDEPLVWSNTDGWGTSATLFTEEEKDQIHHLPLGGKWVERR